MCLFKCEFSWFGRDEFYLSLACISRVKKNDYYTGGGCQCGEKKTTISRILGGQDTEVTIVTLGNRESCHAPVSYHTILKILWQQLGMLSSAQGVTNNFEINIICHVKSSCQFFCGDLSSCFYFNVIHIFNLFFLQENEYPWMAALSTDPSGGSQFECGSSFLSTVNFIIFVYLHFRIKDLSVFMSIKALSLSTDHPHHHKFHHLFYLHKSILELKNLKSLCQSKVSVWVRIILLILKFHHLWPCAHKMSSRISVY